MYLISDITMEIGYVEFVLILLEIVDRYNVVSPGYIPIETSQDLYMLFERRNTHGDYKRRV